MCKTVTLGSSTNIRVAPTAPVPGAQYLNIYAAQGASCSGMAYLTRQEYERHSLSREAYDDHETTGR